jgi:KDO2-lipid IV(A) lauroyltransferase
MRLSRRLNRVLARLFDPLVGVAIALLFAVLRRLGPDRASDRCGALMRRLGPWLPEHRTGRAQLTAAFPDRDAAWIEATLRGAWENLGRVIGEYVHLGQLWDYDPANPGAGRIEIDEQGALARLAGGHAPVLLFTAHLANWEFLAVAARRYGLDMAVLYRMPNSPAIAGRIAAIRRGLMGPLIRSRREAALEMLGVMRRGGRIGMLVDQFFGRGVDITFFGRRCKANPTLARLVRHMETEGVACEVYGGHVVRLPGNRLRIVLTGPHALPRDGEGRIDVEQATQAINSEIESWIREHPEQWLWFHRRWR